MKKTWLLGFLTLLAGTAIASAQAPALTSVALEPDSKHPAYSVQFDVRLPSGELLDDLASSAVTVNEGKTPLTGTLTRGNPHGVAWVVVLDTSGSMSRRLDAIKPALKDLLSKMTPADMAALVTFNDDVSVAQPLTADHAAIESAIEKLATGGHTTELYYGVTKAAELLAAPGVPARRIMLVISDGKDEGTAYTLDDVLRKSGEAGANIAAIGIAGGDVRYLKTLQRMAELTEGTYIQIAPGEPWQAKTALVRKFAESRQHFAWRSALAPDGRAHDVALEVTLGDTIIRKALSITLPAAPPPLPPPDKRIPVWQLAAGAAAALLAVGALVFVLMSRSRKRRAEELAAVTQKVEAAESAKAELQADMERDLGDLREKLATLEDKAPPIAAAPTPVDKRKTVFHPGGAAPSADVYARATLVVLDGALQGANLPLLPTTSIGRDDDNNIVLDEQRVSLHHARIANERGTWWLEDLGSTNGTYVEDRRLNARVTLRSGQLLRVGSVSMRFVGEA